MGYLRFGRRFRIGPGLTMNLSKSGVSWTVRLGPVSWNFGKRGTRRTIDLPGRGLSWLTLPASGGALWRSSIMRAGEVNTTCRGTMAGVSLLRFTLCAYGAVCWSILLKAGRGIGSG